MSESNIKINGNNGLSDFSAAGKMAYRRLFRRFVLYTVVCSVVPLLLVGWGVNLHYTRFAKSRMVNQFKSQIDHHRNIIQLFLNERRAELQLIAGSHAMEELIGAERLQEIFDLINEDYWSFTDLGVIDDQGRHLQYVGPYDLLDKNYSQTFWFKEVMQKGFYISDMFMGFRKEPHFVIAVAGLDGERTWILRATVDTEFFRSLVENVTIGKTGEVCLLNRDGVFQTSPRFGGNIMEKSSYPVIGRHEGIVIEVWPAERQTNGSKTAKKLVGRVWLTEPAWMLLIQQDYAEAFNDVNYANTVTIIFIHLMALTILIVSALITRHMITVIRERDAEADQLNEQLMQTGKLAAIGELSAGVAHEINNPLAIVLTERQLLLDALDYCTIDDEGFKHQVLDSLAQIDIQVQRCKRITQNLLRFAKRTESVIEAVNINAFIQEVIDLIEREARANGIRFIPDFEEILPTVHSDPSQLQQVFLNLITNAIDAHENKPYGAITISTSSDNGRGIRIGFTDTGSGIPPDIRLKIFDPFFTTKTVGKGTGLGLSICYSIMKRLGGSIEVESKIGQGSTFNLFLPYNPPPELLESMRGESVR